MFGKLFKQNNWSPIEYNGKKISLYDIIYLKSQCVTLTIRFEQTQSEWEQGIFLKGGIFYINDEQFTDSIYLWETSSPKIVKCIYQSKNRELKIWNIWRIDNGPMDYGHNGAGLYFEETKNGKLYYCNDGYPDDDFNDLIFSIEITSYSDK